MSTVSRLAAALLFLALLPTQSALAWGVDGHHLINRLAGQTLPADVPAFLHTPDALDSLSYYSPLPDHWRSPATPELTTATAPDHYIQLETVDGLLAQLPRNRYDYVRAVAEAQAAHPDQPGLSAEKLGMQPY